MRVQLSDDNDSSKSDSHHLAGPCFFTLDSNLRIQEFDDKLLRRLGLSRGHVAGAQLSQIIKHETPDLAQVKRDLRDKGRVPGIQVEIANPTGKNIPALLHLTRVAEASQSGAWAMGALNEREEHVGSLGEPHWQKQYLLNILNTSADAIIGIDTEGTIVSWNRGAELVFGYRPDEILGSHVSRLVPEELRVARELEDLDRQLQEHGHVRNHETVRITKDGRRIWVVLTRTELKDEVGKRVGYSAIVRDLTERKKLENLLVRSEKIGAAEELVDALAHDMRNPLAGIHGAVQVLMRDFDPLDPRLAVAKEIREQVVRMRESLTNLLDHWRPKPPRRTESDIHELLEKSLILLDEELDIGKIQVERDYDRKARTGSIDTQQMTLVFSNVISNAVQAMPDGGTLRIQTLRENGQVKIRFSDSGAGIPEALVPLVLEPWVTTKPQAAGIGLSLARRVVRAHGGTIAVENRPAGGVRLSIYLPVGRSTNHGIGKNPHH